MTDDLKKSTEAKRDKAMIFAIQRYIEDYFAAKALRDTDQYAVKIANLYDVSRRNAPEPEEDFVRRMRRIRTAFFLRRMRRIRTAFFVNNRLKRSDFEKQLLSRLDRAFLK